MVINTKWSALKKYTSNIQTEQAVCRNVCVHRCTCVHVITRKKEAMNVKESRRGIWEGLKCGQGRGRCCNYNLKKN